MSSFKLVVFNEFDNDIRLKVDLTCSQVGVVLFVLFTQTVGFQKASSLSKTYYLVKQAVKTSISKDGSSPSENINAKCLLISTMELVGNHCRLAHVLVVEQSTPIIVNSQGTGKIDSL